MTDIEPRLKIAIQKSGRLAEDSLDLLKSCGLSFENGGSILYSPVRNFPMDLIFVRDDDIPSLVEQGVADLGIVGNNVFLENGNVIDPLLPLGFGRCQLTVGVPKETDIQTIRDLEGKRIATSYPNITGSYFTAQRIPVNLVELKGSVEVAPTIGAGDAISDLTSTGSTMALNDLRPIEDILKVESYLIGTRGLLQERGKARIVNQLILRISAVLDAKRFRYVAMNAPESAIERIRKIMPGLKSPTVTPLAEDGWFSVQSVLLEDSFWDSIEQLQEAGAQGIIVLPIEKMIL